MESKCFGTVCYWRSKRSKESLNAYQTGGSKAAVKQYGKSVYETSGAKSLVETGTKTLTGDAQAIGSLAVVGAAAVITHKAGAKGTVVAESEGIASVRGKTLSRQQMSTIVGDGGAKRAAQFSSQWQDASLAETLQEFAPKAQVTQTSTGKTIYTNSETGIQVVYDNNGNYFRIEDTNISSKNRYLDGNIPNNVIINGKTKGRSPSEYKKVTHFNNID